MVEISPYDPADQEQYNSHFQTTDRHVFIHNFSNLIIYPAYIVLLVHTTRVLLQLLESSGLVQSVLREGAEIHPTLLRIVETPIVESSLHFLRSAAGDILWIITISVWIIGLIPIVLSLLAINRPEWRSGLRSHMNIMWEGA